MEIKRVNEDHWKTDPRGIEVSVDDQYGKYWAQFVVLHGTKLIPEGDTTPNQQFAISLAFSRICKNRECSITLARTVSSAEETIHWAEFLANTIAEALRLEAEPTYTYIVEGLLKKMFDLCPPLFDYALNYKDPIDEAFMDGTNRPIPDSYKGDLETLAKSLGRPQIEDEQS